MWVSKMAPYVIFTDATADTCAEMMMGLPSVKMIPMTVEFAGKGYVYGPGGNLTIREFYDQQRSDHYASTSQINPSTYRTYFEPVLQQEIDILYLCFSSGMSGCYQSALMCVEDLRQEYPERKILCVDTHCASVGEGFLVRETARKKREGLSIEELFSWVVSNRMRVCHWFTVDVFDHLQHGGRVSTVSAAMGTMLNIKPLLHVDDEGKLEVIEKPRGRKKAIASQIARMKTGWLPEISKFVLIGHGDDPMGAEELKAAVKENFPEAEILIAEIGPIIGAHTGPGMLALIYWGSNR